MGTLLTADVAEPVLAEVLDRALRQLEEGAGGDGGWWVAGPRRRPYALLEHLRGLCARLRECSHLPKAARTELRRLAFAALLALVACDEAGCERWWRREFALAEGSDEGDRWTAFRDVNLRPALELFVTGRGYATMEAWLFEVRARWLSGPRAAHPLPPEFRGVDGAYRPVFFPFPVPSKDGLRMLSLQDGDEDEND